MRLEAAGGTAGHPAHQRETVAVPRAIATNTRVDRAGLVEFLRPRHRAILVTTRADGRPHAVPVDGLWVDGAAYVGGHPATVHERNLRRDPRVVLHLESGQSAVIVEAVAERRTPSADEAQRLAQAADTKYGYGTSAGAYLGEVWCLRPRVVVAWTTLYEDATRFTFDP